MEMRAAAHVWPSSRARSLRSYVCVSASPRQSHQTGRDARLIFAAISQSLADHHRLRSQTTNDRSEIKLEISDKLEQPRHRL